MSDERTEGLRVAEARLQAAQLGSDVGALDVLLHPSLTFVGPDGAISDKAADLDAHRTGAMRLSALVPEDVLVTVVGDTGVTVFTGFLEGSYFGDAFAARMRYTRTWALGPDGWSIVAAHATMLP